jgi:hypothetical protein
MSELLSCAQAGSARNVTRAGECGLFHKCCWGVKRLLLETHRSNRRLRSFGAAKGVKVLRRPHVEVAIGDGRRGRD